MFKSKVKEVIIMNKIKDEMLHDITRQEEAYYKISMLQDNFHERVANKLMSLVSPQTWGATSQAGLKNYVDTSNNLFADVIEQLAQIYNTSPVRDFGKSEEWAEFYDSLNVNSIMEQVDEFKEAVNDVFIMPVFDSETKTFRLDILTPDLVSVRCSDKDPRKIEEFRIKYEDAITPENTYYVVWTDTEHYITDSKNNITSVIGNEDMVNPYGVIPVVAVHRKPVIGSFWNETGRDDLYNACIYANAKNSLENFIFTWSGFKQYYGIDVNPPAGAITSPDSMMVCKSTPDGQGVPSLSIADLQVNLKNLDDHIVMYMQRVKKRYGVNDTSENLSETSGRYLQIKNATLERFRIKSLKTMRKAEHDLYKLLLIMRDKVNMPLTAVDFKIDFADTTQSITRAEELQNLEKEISMNLKSVIDGFIESNPDMKEKSRDEAIEAYYAVVEENNRAKEASIDMEIGADQELD